MIKGHYRTLKKAWELKLRNADTEVACTVLYRLCSYSILLICKHFCASSAGLRCGMENWHVNIWIYILKAYIHTYLKHIYWCETHAWFLFIQPSFCLWEDRWGSGGLKLLSLSERYKQGQDPAVPAKCGMHNASWVSREASLGQGRRAALVPASVILPC